MRKKNNELDYEKTLSIKVIDLFCNIGGLIFGMKNKGFDILAGYDLDATCRYAYGPNNDARFNKEVREVPADEIGSIYGKNSIRVLAGCALCQPFSSCAFKNKRKIRINTIYYTNSVVLSKRFFY